VLNRGADGGPSVRPSTLSKVEKTAVHVWPTLFGFQFLYELEPGR